MYIVYKATDNEELYQAAVVVSCNFDWFLVVHVIMNRVLGLRPNFKSLIM